MFFASKSTSLGGHFPRQQFLRLFKLSMLKKRDQSNTQVNKFVESANFAKHQKPLLRMTGLEVQINLNYFAAVSPYYA